MKWNALVPAAVLTILAGLGAGTAAAGTVDLANVPLISGLTKVVPPNIFFVLDDSTSMSWDYMPDDVNNNNTKFCFKNWGYNKIYYNNSVVYVAPKKADGTSYANATYTAAKDDGFLGSATTDLSAATSVNFSLGSNPFAATSGSKVVTVTHTAHGFKVGDKVIFSPSRTFRGVTVNGTYSIVSVTTNNYTITTTGSNATSTGTGGSTGVTESYQNPTYAYYNYTSSPSSPPATCQADTSYTKKVPTTALVGTSSLTEQQNFANWYSYYRTRINMMKSASGRAFAAVDDKYRVGFDVISNELPSSVLVNIAKFSTTQKSTWYTNLYGAIPFGPSSSTNYTPLRGALSKAGRLYAGKVITGTSDPVQYSCQQNFTILTTDGYWNTKDEVNSGASRYGAYKEDNSTLVGDQDCLTCAVPNTVKPYLDAGKYPNTLADIAMYYNKTDLRPTSGLGGFLDNGIDRLDVSANNVPAAGADAATWQHMTLFGLGLGASGTLIYAENYLSGGSADYNAILQGTKNWPDPQTSQSGDSTGITERIDDLWHAAVNGKGQYLSASNPDAVVSALSKTLAAISVVNASAAAAATSSLEPVAGDNFAYVAQYTTALWYGDLQARDIDLATGALSATVSWSARTMLDSKVSSSTDTRTIKTFDAAGTNKVKDFNSANLTAEKAAGYFSSSPLTQYGTWNATQQLAATNDAMIGFLRGQYGSEDQAGNTNRLFRDRPYTLGDIVNASPVFVKKPPFAYGDAGYSSFATTNASRTPIVYVGANDGMLHALDAATGAEKWAYVPSAVIPRLFKLADAGYATNHEFYVDGPITVGDAYNGTVWKTILIGGLGRGGQAFYALDVTDPTTPKALWEFGTTQDSDLGYSYGNAILTKRSSDGKWVVIFASGYNNTAGDKKGRIYVVDAFSGAKLQEIITDNSLNDPDLSGIAKINNFVLNSLVDNSTQYVYGGDLSGNLWRFDLTAGTSQRLGKTSATAGNQPITVRPELARVRDSAGTYYRVIYFGTGRYLGFGDLSPSSPSATVAQSVYAVKDTGADLGVLTDPAAKLVAQTLDSSVTPRTIPNAVAVDWAAKNGWYMATPVGERVNVDPRLQLGTLVLVSNAPKDDYCAVGGSSWLYTLDYKTGSAVVTQKNKEVGQAIGSSITTGLTLIRLPTNKLIAIVTQADTTVKAMSVPVAPSSSTAVRRVGWREIY